MRWKPPLADDMSFGVLKNYGLFVFATSMGFSSVSTSGAMLVSLLAHP